MRAVFLQTPAIHILVNFHQQAIDYFKTLLNIRNAFLSSMYACRTSGALYSFKYNSLFVFIA